MKKNIWKLLLIFLPIIMGLYLLYPTYEAGQLKDLKDDYLAKAKLDPTAADSLMRMEEFDELYGLEYLNAKNKRLKLGLDLRGGMYVTMEVDVIKLIEEAAQKDAIDDIFNEVLEATRAQELSEEEIIDIFLDNFDEIAKPKKRFLSDYFDFGENVDIAEADEIIVDQLKENEKEAIDRSIEIIRQRVDKYGVSEPTIQKQGTRRIMLELPGVSNEKEMRELIKTTARLQFHLVRSNEELVTAFKKIDDLLVKQGKAADDFVTEEESVLTEQTAEAGELTEAEEADTLQPAGEDNSETVAEDQESATITANDTNQVDTSDKYAGMTDEEKQKEYRSDHPFTTLFDTWYAPEGSKGQAIGYDIETFPKGGYSINILEDNIPRFREILSRPEVAELLPDNIMFMRAAKGTKTTYKNRETNYYGMHSIKIDPELTGEVIVSAQATYDPTTNQPLVLMSMNQEGSERWAKITGQNLKKRVAIILDGVVYSAPVVQSRITGGRSQITGMDSPDEAKLLQIVLKAGALKAPVKIIEERVVGPSLGQDSIDSGLSASLYALILVIIYMVFYYNKSGFIADFAVMLNVFLVVSALAAFQGTLTLPGIAGIILTIGMAVDANILIFERIREELYKGRSLRSAIDEGFGKALSAIVDSNVTTGITGIILFYFGTGPIQGFALTLVIGIFGTLFTGILITRAIIEIMLSNGATQFSFGQPKVITSDK